MSATTYHLIGFAMMIFVIWFAHSGPRIFRGWLMKSRKGKVAFLIFVHFAWPLVAPVYLLMTLLSLIGQGGRLIEMTGRAVALATYAFVIGGGLYALAAHALPFLAHFYGIT